MPRRRQQTAVARGDLDPSRRFERSVREGEDLTGEAQQDTSGVRGRACGESRIRNRRDPTRRSTSDQTGSYKPSAKWSLAGRESEGFIVPLTLGETQEEGRGPTSAAPTFECKCEGMAERPNNPIVKARQAQGGLFAFAKSGGWTQGRVKPARTPGSDALRGLASVALA